jgi:hypothetical protein
LAGSGWRSSLTLLAGPAAESEMDMSDIRVQAEAAAAALSDAYQRTPGVGVECDPLIRDESAPHTITSNSGGEVVPVEPVQYADPSAATMGQLGGGS